ncbi:hypothetical protein [Corynebacterium dentalis]|uniref:hypothetical protein n=1 Tax=Corynebacterium dentalis TaxID=2014528 RepID=UPI0028A12904|nr:hypothetical protein [Corynebacterium dentalis]
MNFDTVPFPPLQTGIKAEDYANVLNNYEYNPDSVWPSLSGEVKVDGEYRLVTFSLEEGVVRDIELAEIKKGDTFCGISMRQRPKKFQKLLAEAGFDSTIEDGGLNLTDHPIGFFIEGGWIASICWEQD